MCQRVAILANPPLFVIFLVITVKMPSATLLSTNKTAQILADAEKGGYGVIAAIA